MWDLIVSVPDHCLSFYFVQGTNPCLKHDSATNAFEFVILSNYIHVHVFSNNKHASCSYRLCFRALCVHRFAKIAFKGIQPRRFRQDTFV